MTGLLQPGLSSEITFFDIFFDFSSQF